jgi:hypothetical protein
MAASQGNKTPTQIWLETWTAFHMESQENVAFSRIGPLRVPHTRLLLTYVPYLVTAVSQTRHHHC